MSILDQSKVLIVGGAGFVGSNLAKIVLNSHQPESVTIVDNLMSAEKFNVPNDDRVNFVEGSIADDEILSKIGTDFNVVFHLACYHGNQSSIHDPIADHDNNTITTLKLLQHLHQSDSVKKLVYSAAGCSVAEKTYDEAEATTEEAPISVEQDSPYSLSKIFGEFYCQYYFRQFNFPAVRVRFQNVYGPGEVLGAGQWRGTPATVWRNVTPTFIYKALHGEALPLENEGLASRDFIFVEDICRGLIAAAENGDPGEVYNLASGVDTTIRELAETINQFADNEGGIELKPARDWDNSGKRYGSANKSKEQLGFEAEVVLKDGIERTIAWTKENQDTIDKCMAKHNANMEAL